MSKRGWGTVLGAVALVAAGGVLWRMMPLRQSFFTDAETIREPIETAHPRDVLWQPPIQLSDIINTRNEDYEPRLSWDGLTLYFVRGKAGEGADIYTSTRTPTGWTEAVALDAVNGPYDDLGPDPSADGKALYFYSNRPGGMGGYDLWVSRRFGEEWQPAAHLGPNVNSEYNDYGPALAPDGETLFFSSNRPRADDSSQPNPDAWLATVREDLFHRTYDLYKALITVPGVEKAQPLNEINTPFNEGVPCISPTGNLLYFASDRPGGRGGFDLYRCWRVNGEHRYPANLGSPINSSANELDPGLTALGYGLYFSSDRSLSSSAVEAPNDYNLYYAASREVYLNVEQLSRPPIDWAAWWNLLGTNLLWALLAFLLLLLLWRLIRDAHRRRLSLLARCLLLSLMAHLVLMFLLNSWQVGTVVADAIRRGGTIKVALDSTAHGGELYSQVRGQLTDVTLPSLPSTELKRLETINIPARMTVRHEFEVDAFTGTPEMPMDHPILTADAPTPYTSNTAVAIPSQSSPTTIALAVVLPANPEFTRVDEVELQVRPLQGGTGESERAQSPTVQTAAFRSDTVPLPSAAERGDLPSETATDLGSFAVLGDASSSAVTEAPLAVNLQPSPIAELTISLPSESAARMAVHEAAGPPITRPTGVLSSQASVPLAPTAALSTTMPSYMQPLETAGFVAEQSTTGLFEDLRYAAPLSLPLQLHESGGTTLPMALSLDVPAPLAAATASADRNSPSASGIPHIAADTARATLEMAPISSMTPTELVPETVAQHPAVTVSLFSPVVSVPTDFHTDGTPSSPPTMGLLAALTPLDLGLRAPADIEETALRNPQHQPQRRVDRLGTVEGTVIDAMTGHAVPKTTVRLDLPNGQALSATSDARGRYRLDVPPVPDFFVISASHPDYVPSSENVAAESVQGCTHALDFSLAPQSVETIALEEVPDVHHLGNDRFEGRINSQFQKGSEGRSFAAELELAAEYLPADVGRARLLIMVKGIQCPHEVRINGVLLDARLDRAPRDGSFGEFVIAFDSRMLYAGNNQIELRAVQCNGDLDDFEFVNIRVQP